MIIAMIFKKKCPCCKAIISWVAQIRLLYYSTTIICPSCYRVLTHKFYVQILCAYAAIFVSGLVFDFFGLREYWFLKGFLGILVFYPAFSFLFFDFKESDYLD